MTEQRVAVLEAQVLELRDANLQLRGALDEQRAAAAARPAPQQQQVVDTRLMGKPKNFSGREEDWHHWAVTMRAYSGAISERLLFLMDEAETAENVANAALESERDKELSTQLYYILTMLLEGKAADKVTLVGRGQGLLLWKALTDDHEGKAVTRTTGLFQQVLNFGFESDDILHELGRFERVIQQYENATGKKVDDELRTGIVIKSIRQEDLAKHIIMNSDRLDGYDKIKDEIVGIYRTKKYLVTGPAPMDVGAVEPRRCDICGKLGHTRRECWYQGGPGGKGRGKGKADGRGKGKGKDGGKDGGKGGKPGKFGGGRGRSSASKGGSGGGKGDAYFDGECGYCGVWGHKRAQCRKLQAARGQGGNRRQVGQLSDQQPQPQQQRQLQLPPPPQQHPQVRPDRGALTATSLASTQQIGSLQLCSVEHGEVGSFLNERRVRIGVDSGAGVTVWPKDLCDDYPIRATPESRAGFEYVPAGKGSKGIVDLGERTYDLIDASGQNMSMKVHVCDVRKPLLSVAEMNDVGLDVHFFADGRKGAYAIHPHTGKRVGIERVNNVFEIEASVSPWSGGSGQA